MEDIRDIKGLVAVPHEWWWLWLALIGVVIAALAFCAAVLQTKTSRNRKVRWIRISIPKSRPTGMDQLRIDMPAGILSS